MQKHTITEIVNHSVCVCGWGGGLCGGGGVGVGGWGWLKSILRGYNPRP